MGLRDIEEVTSTLAVVNWMWKLKRGVWDDGQDTVQLV